jgi:hypothetical protein
MLSRLFLGLLCFGYLSVLRAEPAERFQLFSDLVREANNRTADEGTPLLSLGTGPPSDPSQFRFYNNDTSGMNHKELLTLVEKGMLTTFLAFRVTSLPDVPFSIGEMYSGLMPVKEGDLSRQLFFIYQPTVGPPVDEITIWLNGGPGCSSLEGEYIWISFPLSEARTKFWQDRLVNRNTAYV